MNSGVRGFQFLQGREGYCEEEEEEGKQMMLGDMGKRPFQFSPPSSSSSPCPSSLSHYKGMVPQQKRRLGEQIYVNHQHVCLGAFEREDEAASADPALINFGRHKATTNFNSLELMDLSSLSGNNSFVGAVGDEGGSGGGSDEREHMFEKVVTPSDVGKLNRLVIPKQHAEKYFPLDWAVNEKGLLLNFEDRNGKSWRFRYSYWNSSQSYVMTKGWSRFVKEKKLDAGDIVFFQRGVGELGKDLFYIDCKHRLNTYLDSSPWPTPFRVPHPLSLHQSVPWARVFLPSNVSFPMPPPQMHLQRRNCEDHQNYSGNGGYGYNRVNHGRPLFYPGSQHVGGGEVPFPQGGNGSMASPMAIHSIPMIHYEAAGKRLRLFGVDLDCPTAEAVGDNYDGSLLTPTTRTSRMMTMTSPPNSQPPLQLRLFNGAQGPGASSQLSRKGKESLSLGLDI